MGLFNFLREAGAKLAGHGGSYSAPTPEALEAELKRLGLPTQGLSMEVHGDTIRISDITLPKGAEATITDRDFVIATIKVSSAALSAAADEAASTSVDEESSADEGITK